MGWAVASERVGEREGWSGEEGWALLHPDLSSTPTLMLAHRQLLFTVKQNHVGNIKRLRQDGCTQTLERRKQKELFEKAGEPVNGCAALFLVVMSLLPTSELCLGANEHAQCNPLCQGFQTERPKLSTPVSIEYHGGSCAG